MLQCQPNINMAILTSSYPWYVLQHCSGSYVGQRISCCFSNIVIPYIALQKNLAALLHGWYRNVIAKFIKNLKLYLKNYKSDLYGVFHACCFVKNE